MTGRQATPDVFAERLMDTERQTIAVGTLDPVAVVFGTGADAPAGGTTRVPLDMIGDNPFQERSEYGDLTDLANDIREHGLLQPPVVRQAQGRYELAFGHRRKRACELAGMTSMPVVIRKLSDEEMATIAFSENEQRQDVTAIDKAVAIQTMQSRFGWSLQTIADKLSMSRPAVSNLLRLLDLPETVQTAVQTGEISQRQAAALVPLATLPAEALQRQPTWGDNLDKMVTDAKNGVSSDGLRKRVEQGIRNVSNELPEHWRNYDFGELAGVEAARCTGCRHVIRRGDDQLCAMLTCWNAKSSAWLAIEQAEIVAATGVPMMPEKFDYSERDTFYSRQMELLNLQAPPVPPSFECSNLRLQKGYQDSYDYVCLHPSRNSCKCVADAERAAKKDGKARWKLLRTSTAEVLMEHLLAFPLDALRLLAYQFSSYSDRPQVGTWTAEQCAPKIVRGLIKGESPYDAETHTTSAEKAMECLLRLAGVTVMPWSLAAGIEAGEDETTAIPVL